MNLTFIRDGPALLVEGNERNLVVADTHFGIEADLVSRGLHFRSRTSERLERLMQTIDQADPDNLILLGDIKHSIPSLTHQEFAELPGILSTLRDRVPLIIFPGNHDIGLERFVHKDELRPRDGALVDGVGYLHGHMNPAPILLGNLIILGHHHPLLSLHDEVGCALQEPAYVRTTLATPLESTGAGTGTTRLLFMPAFNELAGYDILRIVKDPFSPLSRGMNRADAEIILADGTFIGPVSMVEHHEDD
jgi:hypothetical protein